MIYSNYQAETDGENHFLAQGDRTKEELAAEAQARYPGCLDLQLDFFLGFVRMQERASA